MKRLPGPFSSKLSFDIRGQPFVKTDFTIIGNAFAENLAVACYSYEPAHDGDLGFEKGEKLKIINR